MDEVKMNLKKMGWNDDLIQHFVGKSFKPINTISTTFLKNDYVEVTNIVSQQTDTLNLNTFIYNGIK